MAIAEGFIWRIVEIKVCQTVVNCFRSSQLVGNRLHLRKSIHYHKIELFVIFIPAYRWTSSGFCKLWIAFKLSSLLYLYQPPDWKTHHLLCCELLSNWVLCYIYTSAALEFHLWISVVNCFQIEFFVIFIPA